MSIQIIEVEIPVAGITEITVYFGAQPGGGASTFAELTDKATADLPAINGPLGDVLALKAPLASPTFTTPALGVATATSIGVSGSITAIGSIGAYGNIEATGNISTNSQIIGYDITAANGFSGPGPDITDLDAGNISTGNIARARIDNALSANAAPIVATTVTASGAVTIGGNAQVGTKLFLFSDKIGVAQVANSYASGSVNLGMWANNKIGLNRSSGDAFVSYNTGTGTSELDCVFGGAYSQLSYLGTAKLRVGSGNIECLTNTAITGNLTASGTVTATGNAILPTSTTPASAGATGVAGTICRDASYLYVCTATNTWTRIPLAW